MSSKAEQKEGGADSKNGEDEPMPIQPFKFYLGTAQTYKIISTRWGLFTLLASVIYCIHLVCTIAGVNHYADGSRFRLCPDAEGAANTDPESASAVFDSALLLTSLFHMIEWVRWTVFLTSALVGANLIALFYVLSINVVFGPIALIYAIAVRFSADGDACSAEGIQAERASFLSLQILCLVVFVLTSFAHVLLLKLKGVEWCHEQFIAEEEEDD